MVLFYLFGVLENSSLFYKFNIFCVFIFMFFMETCFPSIP